MLRSVKVIVTGGADSSVRICQELMRRGYRVTVLDNLTTGRMENITHLLKATNLINPITYLALSLDYSNG
jgi:UDP-glucose 4-epimerase